MVTKWLQSSTRKTNSYPAAKRPVKADREANRENGIVLLVADYSLQTAIKPFQVRVKFALIGVAYTRAEI